jgi:capsular exopolysaccharide synthesis family protein
MVDNPQIKIITAPEVAQAPYNSFSDSQALLKGALLGAALALLIIFICSVLARTIQTTDELKTAVNIPLLVALPKVTPKKRRSNNSPLITADTDPNMNESFRGLRMKIKKMMADSEYKTILLTSTLAGEGKTTVAINIALSLAQESHKVLILDADLRSQSIARYLGEKTTGGGLMECIKNNSASILDFMRTSETYGIDFISGRSTEKHHYSLNAERLKNILKQLSERYDYIIIDTPPQDIVSDSAALSRCADWVLYVVRQDNVQKAQIINAITAMHEKDIMINGCIFNGVPKFHRQYGYGYRSGYGYGYDYGYRRQGYRYGYHYGYRQGYGYHKKAQKEKS